jgi:6-phosphogluconate dehydrogenase
MAHPGELAIVGLGKIGGGLARQALDKGFRVVGFTLGQPSPVLITAGLVPLADLHELSDALRPPRRVLLYIPAGPAVDGTLRQLTDILDAGDVVVDGGNSYWGDSLRRHQSLAERRIHFVDMGTSGGVSGARNGACLMAGGTDEAIALVEPMLKALAVEGGYVHAGPPGAGHFVKLVHNGIEFGMLQAIAEGVDLLESFRDRLPVADIVRTWTKGSVIRSWLIELLAQHYRDAGGLAETPGVVEDTGEVNWLVQDALDMEVPIPVIAQSVMQLIASRDERRTWARAIAAMRHGFGGHPFGRDDSIRRGRRTSRVGDLWRD